MQDVGCREPQLTQPLRHGDEWRHALGQMRDGAVGLVVAHRRAVGTTWRVHQDETFAAKLQPVIDAGRGVARHAPAHRLAHAALGDELAHRRDPLHPRREAAVAGHARVAEFELELGGERERDVEPVRRQRVGRPVRPFDHDDSVLRQIVEAELGHFGGARQAVEIGVHQRKLRQIVGLHQREGRARHLDRFVAREIANECAHERSLAGAEIARKGNDVTGLERARDVDHQPSGGLLVRQHHREARTAGGQQHGHSGTAGRPPWRPSPSRVTPPRCVPRPVQAGTRR